MNKAEFGQKIKAKYPQYNNISDDELADKMIAKYPQYKSQIQDVSTPAVQPQAPNAQTGFFGKLSSINPGKIGIGAIKGFAQTFTGLAGLATEGAKAIGIPQSENSALSTTKAWADKSDNWGESIGKGVETIGELVSGEEALKGLSMIPKTKWGVRAVKAGIGATLFGGQEAAKSGDTKGVPMAATLGAIAPGATELLGNAAKSAVGTLSENVSKALGFTGKMNVSDVANKIPQATRALETIANTAKDIVVKDIDGVEKTFEPTKATFGETLQALKSTKDTIYKQYSDLATKAGDAGAKFTKDDFNSVTSKLEDIAKNRTTPYANKASQILKDITRIFPKGEADLPKIQSLIEDINKDVNPLSDKASAEVSSEVSKTLREIMDNKIVSSTNEGYQALRSQYSDLKSIENDLINKWKRSARGTGSGVSNWVEGFGTLDTAVSILTGNISEGIRGAGTIILGKAMKYLKDPEANLQKAFGQILKQGEEKASSGIGKFLFDSTPASESERQAAKESLSKATAPVKGIPAGMSINSVAQKVPTKNLILGDDFQEAISDVNQGIKTKSKLPILAKDNGDGTFTVLDGNHRLAEKMASGDKDIQVITDETLYRKLSAQEEYQNSIYK